MSAVLHKSDPPAQLASAQREQPLSNSRYLASIGERVRDARARRGMTRKSLAQASGVSERYLAQLESGEGNISVLLLRQVAHSLHLPLENLLLEGPEPSEEFMQAAETLRRLPPDDLQRASKLLLREFAASHRDPRSGRIALIGLRGAGKSTLGSQLAARLRRPFIELDRQIEATSGMKLSAIFDLYGQSGFRRFERECLENILESTPRFVLATGGSIVSEPATFARLLASCQTIWIRTTPEEHMKRVMAQGDMRPMAENKEAMSDLRRILAGREPLYRKADAILDTSGKSEHHSLERLLAIAQPARNGHPNSQDSTKKGSPS